MAEETATTVASVTDDFQNIVNGNSLLTHPEYADRDAAETHALLGHKSESQNESDIKIVKHVLSSSMTAQDKIDIMKIAIGRHDAVSSYMELCE